MSCIYPILSKCHNCLPPFIADQVDKIKSELVFCLEQLYVGGSAYRYKGEGNSYLNKKSIYIASNPWDLAKSVAIYSIISAIGYLIASTGAVWIGYGIMVGCAFFAIGEVKENWGGNHLEKALNEIKPLETLPAVKWSLSSQTNQINIELSNLTENVMRGLDKEGKKTEIVVFKLKPPENTRYTALIKIYYLGSEPFSRSQEKKQNTLIVCNNILRGEEIKDLLSVAKPTQTKTN